MNSEIENLIEMTLADGEVTEKERAIILRKAEALGEDVDEVEMILDGKLHLTQKADTPPPLTVKSEKPKSNKKGDIKKCPSCGSPVESFSTKCNECGHEFRNVEVNSSVNELLNELKKISKSKFKDEDGYFEEYEYVEARAETIRNFAIPTSKEDLIEFATKGISEFNSKETDNEELNSAWESKAEEAISKLNVFALNDKSIIPIIENLEKKFTEKLKRNRKEKQKSGIENMFWIVFSFGLAYLMYAFILSWFGLNYWPFN